MRECVQDTDHAGRRSNEQNRQSCCANAMDRVRSVPSEAAIEHLPAEPLREAQNIGLSVGIGNKLPSASRRGPCLEEASDWDVAHGPSLRSE